MSVTEFGAALFVATEMDFIGRAALLQKRVINQQNK
ncbi:hypothetical protein [Sporisorium scitamineum]|uniref:Uncharacterized protein n=1 Tax=Sporisorium scitamineum TaxID=49012 RepID=A0A0F7RY98_9BASI|nr:hypothetical protein [Sporisorium scitamineum]